VHCIRHAPTKELGLNRESLVFVGLPLKKEIRVAALLYRKSYLQKRVAIFLNVEGM
jgi:hypothetical protein